MISSKFLYEFYKEYAAWLAGNSEFKFSRRDGLCVNLYDYAATMGYSPGVLCEEMHKQFDAAGLHNLLPFNRNIAYSFEVENGVTDRNPNRVKWVHSQIEESSWLYESAFPPPKEIK